MEDMKSFHRQSSDIHRNVFGLLLLSSEQIVAVVQGNDVQTEFILVMVCQNIQYNLQCTWNPFLVCLISYFKALFLSVSTLKTSCAMKVPLWGPLNEKAS